MNIAEQIYALVKSLPQEQASEVLTFAEFTRTKHLSRRCFLAIAS
ncbi:DUF2281 domain-containing protein [Nostoc sphaeroides]|nr:DUF2281 domain-containing protein [Nostoc sphaeroides]